MQASRRFSWLVATAFALASQLASATIISYTANLTGSAEAPPNNSSATGSTTVTVDTVAHTMRVVFSFSALESVSTVGHIHCCTAAAGTGTAIPATATPSFPDFPTGVTSGSYDRTFDLTLNSSFGAGFLTAQGSAAAAEAALLAGLAGGQAYLNIHSQNFGGGEIRGFLTLPAEVHEPDSLALLALALCGWFARRRAAMQ